MTRERVDIFLDRGIKTIGIIGFCGAVFMAVNGMLYLPKKVEANEVRIEKTLSRLESYDQWRQEVSTDISLIKRDVQYIAQAIKDVKNEKRG